jgi:2'-5' RNA ligase
MVHSVELLLDPDTESAVRRVWTSLAELGLRAPAPTSRPHVTLVVADHISPDVDALLVPVTARMPFGCVIGPPLVFGASAFTLVRLVVASVELLTLQAEVARTCLPHLHPGPAPNTVPGQWTPHVTLARRVDPRQLARAVAIRRLSRDITGSVVGLRRWDGNTRVEYLIS